MMLKVPFTINSQTFANDQNQRVSFAVPFAKSSLFSLENLTINSGAETYQNANFDAYAFWPDGSIKWCKCEFLYNVETNHHSAFYISDQRGTKQTAISSPNKTSHIQVKESESTVSIECKNHTYQVNKHQLGLNCLPWSFQCNDRHGNQLKQKIKPLNIVKTTNPLSFELTQTGILLNDEGEEKLEFDCKYTFLNHESTLIVDLTLRNHNAMYHHGGKWDLGNEHSFLFQSCDIKFNADEAGIKLSPEHEWQSFLENQTILQASSGGNNWQSNNHFNAERKNTLAFKGYKVTNQTQILEEGLRAQPTLKINNHCFVAVEKFWQNFPKSISATKKDIQISLFPKKPNELHELQPGEQKTHRFIITLNEATINAVMATPHINICPKYLASTNALPFFTSINEQDTLDQIISAGLKHENNFFEKREQIDEYGWRNFGDLYADHETLEYQGDAELISHYNNQYDPLYGFIRQYLLSKNDKWWELAQDLAQHVKDIDIYHTDKDKIEYNHGLFWHTDHYLPAETASHRTYSKYQDANAYQDHAGGGGPGGQHCYTTGLALHYFLTGDETSKQAVIKLAHWITNVYEGSGTFLDYLLKIKNKHIPGQKNVVTGQYPLDRGTGNYIIALIDAYDVSGKQSYLDQASLVIKNTAKPNEDLSKRNLANIEESWFYTVFLQAVGRYLHIKEANMQFDESFKYSQSLLLHYAQWMLDNEQPYLETPDILEYPNHTWAAQDIRKANVLFLAYYFELDKNKAQQFKAKADSLYEYVSQTLLEEKTHYYTRILSILMQNHGVKSFVEEKNSSGTNIKSLNTNIPEMPLATKKQMLKVLGKSILSTSIKKELTWLRMRSQKIDELLQKVGIEK